MTGSVPQAKTVSGLDRKKTNLISTEFLEGSRLILKQDPTLEEPKNTDLDPKVDRHSFTSVLQTKNILKLYGKCGKKIIQRNLWKEKY